MSADAARAPSALPAGLAQAFRLAAAELGMCSAAWLFAEEVAAAGGEPLLTALRDELGRAFPVLDTVVAARLEGAQGPDVALDGVLALCQGASRVLVVGNEARFLDPLVQALPGVDFVLLTSQMLGADWDRVAANFAGRVTTVQLGEFQRYAGLGTVLLTFVYGVGRATAHVLPTWVRVGGEDTRTQFRRLVGWDVLRRPFYVYPRWLVEVSTESFTHLVTR